MVPGSSPLAFTISNPYSSVSGCWSSAPSTACTATVIRNPLIESTLHSWCSSIHGNQLVLPATWG
jgi:hypothetical protein